MTAVISAVAVLPSAIKTDEFKCFSVAPRQGHCLPGVLRQCQPTSALYRDLEAVIYLLSILHTILGEGSLAGANTVFWRKIVGNADAFPLGIWQQLLRSSLTALRRNVGRFASAWRGGGPSPQG